jgi:hypothetical protein
VFLHSVILAKTLGIDFKPEMVAGLLGDFGIGSQWYFVI